MKPFFALYVKELKTNKALFLFLLLLIAGMNAYGVIRVANVSQESFVLQKNIASDEFVQKQDGIIKSIIFLTLPIDLAKFIFVLSLPCLLAHAFNTEWKSETHYLMFGLPVPQYKVILAKVAAVASVGFVGGGIVIGSVYLSMVHIADLLSESEAMLIFRFRLEDMSFFYILLATSLMLVTYMVFIFGIVVGMEGVKVSVKRYRKLAAVVSFVLFLLFYFFTIQGMPVFTILLGPVIPFVFFKTSVAPFIYTILIGILFLIIGLVMYEKRAEI